MKKKKNWLYLPILLLLASCTKEDIPTPQSIVKLETPVIKVDSSTTHTPALKTIYAESYRNQTSGIAFTWHWNNYANPYKKIMNNDEKGDYGAGQAYADVNGDGFEDILVSYSNDNIGYKGIRWYINKGDNKHFNSDTTYINANTFGNTAHKILKTEINKDGKPDYIILGVDERQVGNYSGNFNVLLSTSTNKFDFKTIPNPNKYWFHNGACGDLNGDGNVDVITATFIWYGDGTGNFVKSDIELNNYTKAIVVYEILDINKDGKSDIILGGHNATGNTTIVFNNGTFNNADYISFPKNTDFEGIFDIEFFDVDSDGDLDMVELRADGFNHSKIFTYMNTPTGYVLDPSYFDDSLDGGKIGGSNDEYGWSSFKFDDVDADGVVDLVAENYHDSISNGYKKTAGKWVKTTFN